MNWFLNDRAIRHERVKVKIFSKITEDCPLNPSRSMSVAQLMFAIL